MYIESVQLKNFRNYETLELNLDRETNIFTGIMHRENKYSGICISLWDNKVS